MESERFPAILQLTEQDIALLLASKCHLGSQNISNRMKRYVFSRRADGIFLIHLGKLWEKLILAARVIAAVTSSQDIYVISSSLHGRRPASKISTYLGASCKLGRFPPGQFTKSLEEPTLLICMDPYDDAQAIMESSMCNIPVIAFANAHSSLKYVDIAIPCNNFGSQAIGVMCWLLTRAVLRLRGVLDYQTPWNVIHDMFFFSVEAAVEDDENVIESYQDDNYGHQQIGGYGQAYWSANGAFSSFDVNWQADMPKGGADEWPGGGFQGAGVATSFGSSDIIYRFNDNQAAAATQPQFDMNAPFDWAEDVPEEEQQEQFQQEPEGWNSSSNNDSMQWNAASAPWNT